MCKFHFGRLNLGSREHLLKASRKNVEYLFIVDLFFSTEEAKQANSNVAGSSLKTFGYEVQVLSEFK